MEAARQLQGGDAMMWFDPMYFVILAPAIVLGLWAQLRVKSAYHAASQVRAASGLTGAQVAHDILEAHGIRGIGIEPSHGYLSDHYDPRAKVMRLSPDVFQGRSVAALGIAAHEAGHAVQDHVHYGPLKLRNGIVPFAMVGSNLSWILIIIGLAIGATGTLVGTWMIWGGIVLFSIVVLFQLINLPVEFDASRRAKDLLQSSGLVAQGEEARAMNRVLNAAALTYVAATLTAVLQLVYLVLRSGVLGQHRD
jgi:hypothetical protein